MYKILSLIFIIILFLYGDGEYTLCDVASSFEGEFYFYTYQNIEFSNCNQIVNGNGYILKTDTKSAKIIYNQLNKSLVKGFSFCVSENQLNVQQFLKNLDASIFFEEKIDEINFCYAYSPIFKDFVTIDGQKINLQICKSDGVIKIGVPLILGSI